MKACAKLSNTGVAILAAICAAVLLPYCADAEQIDATKFKCSFNITFDGYAGSSTLADFPVLIRLSSELNGFRYDKCAANGGDLRFADAAGNLLAHEIDTWIVNGTSLVWVKVPSLNSSTVIKACYGYKGAGDPPAVTASDVWSNGYVGVWHLGESASPLAASTMNASEFKTFNSGNAYRDTINGIKWAQDGAVGGSVKFGPDDTYTNSCLRAAHKDAYEGMDALTVEAWTFRESGTVNNGYVVDMVQNSNANWAWRMYDNSSFRVESGIWTTNEFGTTKITLTSAKNSISANAWYHQAFTYDSTSAALTNAFLYINGTSKASAEGGSKPVKVTGNEGLLYLGNQQGFFKYTTPFPGRIDEMRVSNVARSQDWIKATYDTVHDEEFASYEVPNDWSMYSHKFNVSFTNDLGTTLTDFPVLIRLSTAISGFSYDDFAKNNGEDLRFADASGNLLASEVDTWDVDGESLVWVKVTSLSMNTVITAYYGNNFAPPVNPKSVWSNGYVGVWHMDETTRNQNDSTTSGKIMQGHTTYTANMSYGVAGVVGKGVEQATPLDAEGKYRGGFQASDSSGLYNDTKTLTVEMWGCQREIVNDKYIIRDKTGSTLYSGRWSWSSGAATTKLNYTVALTNLAAGTGTEYKGVNYSVQTNDVLGAWRHYALVIDNETLHRIEAYHDGTSKKTQDILDADEALAAGSGTLAFGDASNSGAQAYPGTIDELRVSSVARSAAWLKATYDTINNNADFTTYGRVEDNFPGLFIMVR